MQEDPRVTVMTAAMCQGNKLEQVRDEFPDRFFDTGICESHAVAFAAGQAKAGLRPIVDIYRTFLQRSLRSDLPGSGPAESAGHVLLDRAGLTGPDGPTHHGVFDIAYMRLFPNMVVMAPGDETRRGPDAAIRPAARRPDVAPLSQGQPRKGRARRRADRAGPGRGLRLGRRRHAHRLRHAVPDLRQGGPEAAAGRAATSASSTPASSSRSTGRRCSRPCEEAPLVVTVEEGTLEGGFGSAVLEAANAAGVDTRNVVRLGIPDRFIEHAERGELLADLGLDVKGICATVHRALSRVNGQCQIAP